jgi:hypothetical protein
MNTREYRLERLANKKYVVRVCFGLLDTPVMRGGKQYETEKLAREDIKKHAEDTCVKPLILRG